MLALLPHLTTLLKVYSQQLLLPATSCPTIKKKLQGMTKAKQ